MPRGRPQALKYLWPPVTLPLIQSMYEPETLCKILCHNICCLIQSMYELNLKPKFWKEVA